MSPLANHVRTASTDEAAVLLDIQRGRMFSLNPTGSRILELLKAGTAFDQIAAQMAVEFAIAPETAAADTAQFLRQLGLHSLLDTSG